MSYRASVLQELRRELLIWEVLRSQREYGTVPIGEGQSFDHTRVCLAPSLACWEERGIPFGRRETTFEDVSDEAGVTVDVFANSKDRDPTVGYSETVGQVWAR